MVLSKNSMIRVKYQIFLIKILEAIEYITNHNESESAIKKSLKSKMNSNRSCNKIYAAITINDDTIYF